MQCPVHFIWLVEIKVPDKPVKGNGFSKYIVRNLHLLSEYFISLIWDNKGLENKDIEQ